MLSIAILIGSKLVLKNLANILTMSLRNNGFKGKFGESKSNSYTALCTVGEASNYNCSTNGESVKKD